MKRILRESGAWLLILIGVAGCVLPVIPGIPLLIGGLAVLAVDRPWAARLLERVKEKWGKAKERIRTPQKVE
ncbi:PGPGW domain-containing protein [Terriglobus sp. 2YAB30_2]|uniref:PGPGW domain-containing protein n=1 Tax=unclassified Terriglobus TaxID=2628988 RepID=UPI003F9C5235